MSNYSECKAVNVWPSGFITKSIRDQGTSWESEPKLTDLYDQYCSRVTPGVSLEFITEVVDLAIAIFQGPSLTAFNLQQTNGQLVNMWREFVQDTINFIQGKERTMCVSTWLRLLELKPGGTWSSLKGTVKETTITDFKKDTTSNSIAAWLQRENGFEDMLSSMYILFTYRDTGFNNY